MLAGTGAQHGLRPGTTGLSWRIRLTSFPSYNLVLFVPTALRSTQVSFLYLQAGGRGFESRHVHQLYFFQRNSFDVFSAYHLLFRQGVMGSNRLASINLILAAITYYTAVLVHYFGAPSGHSGQSCPLGRRASTISLRLFERRDALLADHAGAVRSTLRPQLPDCPSLGTSSEARQLFCAPFLVQAS